MLNLIYRRLLHSTLTITLGLSAAVSLTLDVPVVRADNAASHVAVTRSTKAEYGKLPTSFIANAGQLDPSVRFEARSSAGSLFFTSGGISLSVPIPSTHVPADFKAALSAGSVRDRRDRQAAAANPQLTAAVRLTFDGSNMNAAIEGADPLPGTANFFIGNDRSQWHTDVKTYAGVTYRDLYPGIDLRYAGHAGTLKGTYTIAPNADPGLIRWQYSGADSTALNAKTGDLQITAAGARLTEQIPQVWQVRADGSQSPVTASYQLDSDGIARFNVGTYDHTQPLIIDPGLVYSTYLGGSLGDEGNAITVGPSGDAYIVGETSSTNFPKASPYQNTNAGSQDVFIARLNPAGNALVYSTYLGGSGSDYGYAIALDQNGYIYVAGSTSSSNFPVGSAGGIAFQTTLNGTQNAFVTQLTPSGNGLYYSTYLGGSGYDTAYGLAVDSYSNAYVTGGATSTNFPVLGAIQGSNAGSEDAFVTELNFDGTGLLYSTYLGGSGIDVASGIALDSHNNAYIAGTTYSTNFPTASAYQTTLGGTANAFAAKISPGGNTLSFSTYLGGNGTDYGRAIAVDSLGYVYVTGTTNSTNFPTAHVAFGTVFQSSRNGPFDAFITEINPSGSGLYYSTYLGGSAGDDSYGITVDSQYNAYITGFTESTDYPTTAGAFQTTLAGSQDATMTEMNSIGTALVNSTYLGGTNGAQGFGIALDSNADTYITGITDGGGFPITGAIQSTYGGGNYDAFLTKFNTLVGRIDTIGIYRAGTFYLRESNTQGFANITVAFNPAGKNFPIVGDWTNTGYDAIGVYDQYTGNFTLCNQNSTSPCASSANRIAFTLGNPNDTPLSGRWGVGVAHAGAGVYRPSNGVLYLKKVLSTGFADNAMVMGLPGDEGVAGDWNGKGYDSPGIYRPSAIAFYLSNQVSSGPVFADINLTYGSASDLPITGDWTAQAHDGVGMFRPGNGFVYLKNALTSGFANNSFFYGLAGDIPVAGHWVKAYPAPPPAPIGHLAPPAVLITPSPALPSNGGNSVPNIGQIGD